jgi:dienelactone hydrolase
VLRWQLAPLVLGLAVALLAGRRWRRIGLVLALGSLATGGLLWWAFPPLRLPGGAPVGTAVVQWTDAGRAEPATADEADRRVVVAQVWYPAVAGTGTSRAAYLGRDARERRAVASGLAGLLGVPPLLLDEARRATTPAAWDAEAAAGRRRPVVLFSPGLGGVRSQATAWALDLARHGYVVVAVDHPHDSAAVVLEDGTVVRSQVRATGDDAEDDRRADGWAAVRAADLRFVWDRVVAGGLPHGLADRVDPARVAVAGHSIGGAAAIQAAAEEPGAFSAVIDLDGFPRNVDGPVRLDAPLLVVVAGRGSGSAEGDREYVVERRRVLAAAGGTELVVDGAAHLSFTDAPLLLPPLPSLVGSGRRSDWPGVTARITRAFLDGDLDALGREGRVRRWP